MTTNALSPRDEEIVASLDPIAQELALVHRTNCLNRGMPHYYFTSGGRSHSEQAVLREKLGTGAAKSGTSKHEVGMAWDANNADAKPIDQHWWTIYGEEAERLGLVWGGRFPSRDLGHVELPQSRETLAAYRALRVAALAITVGAGAYVLLRKD